MTIRRKIVLVAKCNNHVIDCRFFVDNLEEFCSQKPSLQNFNKKVLIKLIKGHSR